jgi:Protein of unknown function (DUF1214)
MPDSLTRAFERFEAAAHDTRAMIEATPRFREREDHRAQAYLSLAEARAMAYNLVIAPRMDHPYVHSQTSWHANFFSLGQNCQDFRYGALLLDGRYSYRLYGHTGDLVLSLLQVTSHVMGHPEAEELGNHDLCELAASDGSFALSAGPGDEDIHLDGQGLNFILVRRILTDVSGNPGELLVGRLGGHAPAPETNPDAMADRLEHAAHMLRFIVGEWCVGLYDLYINAAGGKNRLAHIPGQELAANIAGSPSTTYGLGIYELEPDEALIVEWDPPDSAYWSFQLGDVWSNALDFVNYQTDVGQSTALLDPDGRLRVVVAHSDPGHANWLDTRGRREGSLVMRNYRARSESIAPEVRKVALADIYDELPAGSARVTPDQRRAALALRRGRFRAAFGD